MWSERGWGLPQHGREGLEDYFFTKDGKVIKGTWYKVKLEFLKSKK